MTDQTLPVKPKKPIPIGVLVAVFIASTLVSGVVIFIILQQLVDLSPSADYDALIISEQTNGVREINPPREVLDFTLTSHTGEPLSLSDLRGRPVLLYFGYTHCPDVCLMTLADFEAVRGGLGDAADEVAFLFVGVDGLRDTPDKLARYFKARQVENFMIGMSGEDAVLQRISPDYDLFYELGVPDETGYYTVDHTANLFLLDAAGRLSAIFAFGTETGVIVEQIKKFM